LAQHDHGSRKADRRSQQTVRIQIGEMIMTTFTLIKTLGSAIVLSSFALSNAAADTEHTTKVACYASVQTQCYGNGESNCTDGEYQEGLGWCDQYYEIAVPKGGATNLKAAPARTLKFGNSR
jgi:hypothetical protein